MIIRDLNNVENAMLHDAILIASYTYNFNRVYVDPNKECAIIFSGKMSEKDIQNFFFNMNENITCDSCIKDEKVEEGYDYQYDSKNDVTEIYTRNGWKY